MKRPPQGDRWHLPALPTLRSFANAQDDKTTLSQDEMRMVPSPHHFMMLSLLVLGIAPPGRPQGSHPLILTTPDLTKTMYGEDRSGVPCLEQGGWVSLLDVYIMVCNHVNQEASLVRVGIPWL